MVKRLELILVEMVGMVAMLESVLDTELVGPFLVGMYNLDLESGMEIMLVQVLVGMVCMELMLEFLQGNLLVVLCLVGKCSQVLV
jgi:hypothetical protein